MRSSRECLRRHPPVKRISSVRSVSQSQPTSRDPPIDGRRRAFSTATTSGIIRPSRGVLLTDDDRSGCSRRVAHSLIRSILDRSVSAVVDRCGVVPPQSLHLTVMNLVIRHPIDSVAAEAASFAGHWA